MQVSGRGLNAEVSENCRGRYQFRFGELKSVKILQPQKPYKMALGQGQGVVFDFRAFSHQGQRKNMQISQTK